VLHQLIRFSSIAPLVREVEPGEVLDVGSGTEGIAGWVSERCRVTAVDLEFDQVVALSGPGKRADEMIVADARALPLSDDAFDVTVALDVLEHIEPVDRARVLDELVRVTRTRVIVAGPTGQLALDADMRLAGGLRARGVTPPLWLVEHERNGFPERDEIVARLERHGAVRTFGNESLRWHDWLFRFEFRRPGFHVSRAASRAVATGLRRRGPLVALSRLALRGVRGPDSPPTYRTIAVLDLRSRSAAPAAGRPRP